jgi:hypothetical protein
MPAPSSLARSPVRIRAPWVAAGCLALAGLSLLAPSAPTTDPWGWIVWGREILHLSLSTIVPRSPSWKPLPVLATTPLALAGGAAPWLWLLLARAAGLAALVVGFRLAERLAGRAAGVVAVAALAPGTLWMHWMAHGYTEPLAVGLLFGAVLCELSGRPRWALGLGALVALARPEAWCLVVLYGLVLLRRRQIHPAALAACVLAVPLLWLVPDWLGSGDPFHASKVSRLVVPTGTAAALAAVGQAALMAPLPLTITGVLGSVLAMRRGDRRLVAICAVVAVWAALLATLWFGGYPADGRFFILPASLLCVVGAAGAELIVRSVAPSRRIALAAVLALCLLPFLAERTVDSVKEANTSLGRARLEAELRTTLSRAAVPLRQCDRPMLPKGLAWLKGQVAWTADLPLRRVRTRSSSAARFVDLLPHEPGRRLTRNATVTVYTHRTRFVLLAPFADARVRIGAHPGLRLHTVAADGHWRALVPANTPGCSAPA